jgi:dihydroflavonol-4-reductase
VKILLTGGTGFLGSRVTRLLAERGAKLTVLHRKSSALDSIRSYVSASFPGDITDPIVALRAADGMDVVIHMAADLSHWRQRRERVFRTNVTGTRVIAEAAKTAGVPALLHISSIAAVGYSSNGVPIDESAPNNFVPLHLMYHESKRLAEEEALDAVRYGVKVIIVNPGVLYGPRSLEHTFGHTMLELAAGKIPGHPTGGISVTDVDDAAFGIVSALDRGRSGERYLLTGHNLRYTEVFQRQAECIGVKYAGRPLPSVLLSAAARVFELRSRFTGIEPRLTIDNAKIAPLLMWYDHAKARRELGYRIRRLEETFERMARAYRDAGLLAAVKQSAHPDSPAEQ